MRLSFIIPVYNEAENLPYLKSTIACLQAAGHEVIVVDGGSTDSTFQRLKTCCQKVIMSDVGRARQMNAGASLASGDVLVFLHGDTILPSRADELIQQAIANKPWGRFDVKLSGTNYIFRIIETMMNLRSCITAIATGDQCVYVSRQLFDEVAGYPDIPLMEDIALSRRLRKIARPFCIHERVITSSRHWGSKGILRTIVLMWGLRLAYFLGVSPKRLHKIYYAR